MPKVVTPLNLDFDEKEEFVRLFGEGELSKFVRQCIHEKLEEKNREACINLSAIKSAMTITIPKHDEINNTLDTWINSDLSRMHIKSLLEIKPKAAQLMGIIRQRERDEKIIHWRH